MAYNPILFVPKNKSCAKGLEQRLKRVDTNRLHVGYLLRDWTMVFYCPSDNTQEIDRQQSRKGDWGYMCPEYTASGSDQLLREGEIAFLPHFDPKHIQAQKPSERDSIHKKTLWDAFRYLEEDNQQRIKSLERKLDDPHHRRWHTLFFELKKWKKDDLKKKNMAPRGGICTQNLSAQDRNDPDVDTAEDPSDATDDEAYQSEEEVRARRNQMGPPKPPRKRSLSRDQPESDEPRRRQRFGSASSISSGCPLGRNVSSRGGPREPQRYFHFFNQSSTNSDEAEYHNGPPKDCGDSVLDGTMDRDGTWDRPIDVDHRDQTNSRTTRALPGNHFNATVTGPFSIGQSENDDGQSSLSGADLTEGDHLWPRMQEYLRTFQGDVDEDDALERAMKASMTPGPSIRHQTERYGGARGDASDEDCDIQRAVEDSMNPSSVRNGQLPSQVDDAKLKLDDTAAAESSQSPDNTDVPAQLPEECNADTQRSLYQPTVEDEE